MEAQAIALVLRMFREVIDPRQANARHRLIDILTIAMMAILSDCDDYEAIVDFGRDNRALFKQVLALPHGIPSVSTFRRVFARLDPEELGRCLKQWTQELAKCHKGKQIAIDGKTLCGSIDRAWNKLGVHMVTAYCVQDELVLAQVATDQKSNEITAVPKLLEMVDLEGAVVTGDAMNCQKRIIQDIVRRKGDYVIAVKENHPTLYGQVRRLLNEARLEKFASVQHDTFREVNGGHGRVETRRVYCSSELVQWVSQRADWAGLKSIVLVERQRRTAEKDSLEQHYFLSSLAGNDAKRVGRVIRNHWAIENGQHWCLDMGFREDECQVCKDNGPQNLAAIRRIALNLLKRDKSVKLGISNKRKKAARNRDYMFKLLTQSSNTK